MCNAKRITSYIIDHRKTFGVDKLYVKFPSFCSPSFPLGWILRQGAVNAVFKIVDGTILKNSRVHHPNKPRAEFLSHLHRPSTQPSSFLSDGPTMISSCGQFMSQYTRTGLYRFRSNYKSTLGPYYCYNYFICHLSCLARRPASKSYPSFILLRNYTEGFDVYKHIFAVRNERDISRVAVLYFLVWQLGPFCQISKNLFSTDCDSSATAEHSTNFSSGGGKCRMEIFAKRFAGRG